MYDDRTCVGRTYRIMGGPWGKRLLVGLFVFRESCKQIDANSITEGTFHSSGLIEDTH